MYGIIEDANLTLEGINSSSLLTSGGSEQKTMERYKGETLALRAMIYFDLVRFFGDVPLKLEPSQADLSNAYLHKTDRDVILDTLMVDLKNAVELLPWQMRYRVILQSMRQRDMHMLCWRISQ